MKDEDLSNDELEEKIKRQLLLDATDKQNFLNSIKNFIKLHYQPAHEATEANMHFTTNQLFDKLQEAFPSNFYTATQVAEWMNAAGFIFADFGNMRFEWLINTYY